jgi:hypothetical protein
LSSARMPCAALRIVAMGSPLGRCRPLSTPEGSAVRHWIPPLAGAMLVAAAGLLEGRPAITHHSAIDDLRAAGAEVIHARVVDAGDVITAGGVTSGLDLALHLVERDHGSAAALAAERELEYERRGIVWRA